MPHHPIGSRAVRVSIYKEEVTDVGYRLKRTADGGRWAWLLINVGS